MTLLYQSLSTLDTVGSEALETSHRITLVTAQGLVNTTLGTWGDYLTAPIVQRIDDLEATLNGEPIPSVWPSSKTIMLAGPVTGSVSLDGSTNVLLNTTIANGALSTQQVSGLETRLQAHTNLLNLVWTTGFSAGAQITTYAGDLNQLTGAVFLQSNSLTSNKPATTGADFTVLNNGPQNYANQLALRKDEVWSRSQDAGTWGSWYKHWTTANLDPSTLLLKTDVAGAALKLANARTLTLSGVVSSAPAAFDGTGNVTLVTTVPDAAFSIAKTAGLQTSLDSKLAFQYDLDNTVDLDTVQTFGIYSSTGTFYRGALHYPVNGSVAGQGVLEVVPTGLGIQQTYRARSDLLFVRTSFGGGSWSGWIPLISSINVNQYIDSKMNTAGGVFTGNVAFSPADSLNLTGLGLISTVNASANQYALVYTQGGIATSFGALVADGVNNVIALRTDNNTLSLSNGATDSSGLTYNGQTVWNGGNFNPQMPVPASGVLYVGDSAGAHLRLRNDGQYSIDGGSTWNSFGGGGAGSPDPIFNTISLKSDGILFSSEVAGRWNIRTGVDGSYKYFSFGEDGNFNLSQGQIFVDNQLVWNAGNFNPASKLDATATAVAATKLATGRKINNVPFDGTQDITIASVIASSFADDMSSRKASGIYAATSVGPWPGWPSDAAGFGGVLLSVSDDNNVYYKALQLAAMVSDVNTVAVRVVNGDGTSPEDKGAPWKKLWHEGTFDPTSKWDKSLAVAAGIDISGGFPYATDLNTLNDRPCFFNSLVYSANHPPGYGEGAGITLYQSPSSSAQLVASTYGTDGLYFRRREEGTWKAWRSAWHDGNFNPLSPQGVRFGDVGTQLSCWSVGWSDGVKRWAQVLEADGSAALYSYDATGANSTALLRMENIATTGGSTRAFSLAGGYNTTGAEAGYSLDPRTSGGSFTLYNDTDVLNIWSSTAGGTVCQITATGQLSTSRISCGYDAGVLGGISCNNWFRSSGQTGILFNDYGGGLYMTDTNYVRVYGGKSFYCDGDVTTATMHVSATGIYVGGTGPLIYNGGTPGNLNVRSGTSSGYKYFTFSNDGNFYINNGVVGSSDRRLKKQIKPLKADGSLRPVSYTRKDSGQKELGFIAQEVQVHYPEVVFKNQDGYLGIDYSRLVAVLASQHNDLKASVDKKDRELERLKKELKVLTRSVTKLLKNKVS